MKYNPKRAIPVILLLTGISLMLFGRIEWIIASVFIGILTGIEK